MTASSRKNRQDVGALVIGGDYQGLGIVRSLGRQGVRVCVIDDELSIARYSRFTTMAQGVPRLDDSRNTARILLDVGKKRHLRGWVLYPTRDELVLALSQNREELAEFFRVPTPSWNSVRWFWDKRNTYALAAKLGIPIPKTWYVRELSELDQFEDHFPVAIKPAIKEHFFYATGVKAWRANTTAELKRWFRRGLQLMPRDEIIIQDLVPGNGSCQYSYCSFFKQGQSIASLVTCRRRQHPLEFGRASTYVESVDIPMLEELSLRFLRAIDFYGLVEMEYKRDERDGQFRLLDVNGRTWGYHSIGRLAGVDFPYLLFEDQINGLIEASRGKAGVRWIRLLTDLPTGFVSILHGQTKVKDYLRSLRQFDEDAVFSREDPIPGLLEVAMLPYLSVKRGF
jgi:D-aspartate ligase